VPKKMPGKLGIRRRDRPFVGRALRTLDGLG
jgi:hypothetical protein